MFDYRKMLLSEGTFLEQGSCRRN